MTGEQTEQPAQLSVLFIAKHSASCWEKVDVSALNNGGRPEETQRCGGEEAAGITESLPELRASCFIVRTS